MGIYQIPMWLFQPIFFSGVVCSVPHNERSLNPHRSLHTHHCHCTKKTLPDSFCFLEKVTLREVCANKNAKFHVSLLGCWLSFSWPVLENEEAKNWGPQKKLPSFFRVWICKAKYSINIIMTAHPHTFKQETPHDHKITVPSQHYLVIKRLLYIAQRSHMSDILIYIMLRSWGRLLHFFQNLA